MKQVTKDELNTLISAAFLGVFGTSHFLTGMLAKVIAQHKDAVRPDILEYIIENIEKSKATGWTPAMDKVCWARLLDELKPDE